MRTFEEQITNYNIYIARGEEETTLVYNDNGKDTRTVYTSAPKTCKQNIKTKLIKLLGKENKNDINNYVNTFFPRKKRVCTKKITEETQIDQLTKMVSNLSNNVDTLREEVKNVHLILNVENKIIKEKIDKIENTMSLDMWYNLSVNIKTFMDLQTVPIPTQLEKEVQEPIIKKEEPIIKEEEKEEEEEEVVEDYLEFKKKLDEDENIKNKEEPVVINIEKEKKDIVYNSTVILNNPAYETHKKRFNIKVIPQKDIIEDPCEEIYNQHHQKVGYVKYKTSFLINAPTDEFDIMEDDNGDYVKEYTLYEDFAIGTKNIKGDYKPKIKYCKYWLSAQDGYYQAKHITQEVPTEEDIKNQNNNCLIPKMKKRSCPEEAERRRKAMRDKFNNNNNNIIINPVC